MSRCTASLVLTILLLPIWVHAGDGAFADFFGSADNVALIANPKTVTAYYTGDSPEAVESTPKPSTNLARFKTITVNPKFKLTNVWQVALPPKKFITLDPTNAFKGYVSHWHKLPPGTVLSTKLASRLSRLLLEERTYFRPPPGWVKNCVPMPDYVVTFSDGERSIDLFFDPSCQEMEVGWGTVPKDERPTTLHVCLAPERTEVLELLKLIFVGDRRLEEIKWAQ